MGWLGSQVNSSCVALVCGEREQRGPPADKLAVRCLRIEMNRAAGPLTQGPKSRAEHWTPRHAIEPRPPMDVRLV